MRNKFPLFILAILFLYMMMFTTAAREVLAQEGKTFLWKVESQSATVYILGSIHMLKKEDYPLKQKIEQAFERADTLAVEADVRDGGKKSMAEIMERALYPEDDSIENHLSRSTYNLLQKEAGDLGLPLEMFSRQKPWFVAMALEAMGLMRLGFDPQYGLDNYFLSRSAGKKILEVEGLAEQIDLVAGLSDPEQESLLLLTLKDRQNMAQDTAQLVAAWKSGDTAKMEAVIAKGPREDRSLLPIYEKLINDRNRKMVSKIADYARGKGVYFVVLGAGHLVGGNGIIEALRQKGYRPEQL